MRIIGLVLALLLITPPALADYHRARNFARFCFIGDDPATRNFCLGYIVGVAQVLNNVTKYGGTLYGLRACLPPDLGQGQAVRAVREHLNGHPELDDATPDRLIAEALAAAFTCAE